MSMPMICKDPHRQCQDIVMHVLYSGGVESLLRSLISQSLKNISDEFPSAGVRDALSHYVLAREGVSISTLRAVFFILLNQDSRMRARLCSSRVLSYIPELCPYKACRFYDQMRDSVVTAWVKDETIAALDLVENLKDSYLVA